MDPGFPRFVGSDKERRKDVPKIPQPKDLPENKNKDEKGEHVYRVHVTQDNVHEIEFFEDDQETIEAVAVFGIVKTLGCHILKQSLKEQERGAKTDCSSISDVSGTPSGSEGKSDDDDGSLSEDDEDSCLVDPVIDEESLILSKTELEQGFIRRHRSLF